LRDNLDKMRHPSGHATMPERKQAAMKVKREAAGGFKKAICGTLTGGPWLYNADFFEQNGKGDGEAVIDSKDLKLINCSTSLEERGRCAL
jgi:hypothetical protein